MFLVVCVIRHFAIYLFVRWVYLDPSLFVQIPAHSLAWRSWVRTSTWVSTATKTTRRSRHPSCKYTHTHTPVPPAQHMQTLLPASEGVRLPYVCASFAHTHACGKTNLCVCVCALRCLPNQSRAEEALSGPSGEAGRPCHTYTHTRVVIICTPLRTSHHD